MLRSFTSLNNPSTESLSDAFNDIIQFKFNQSRCLDPLLKEGLEREIEPFQSSLQLHLGARGNVWGQYDQELHIRRPWHIVHGAACKVHDEVETFIS